MPNQDLSESGKEKIRTRTEGEAKVYSTRRRGWRCKESLGAWNKKSCNEKLDRDSLPILCWLRCMIRSPSFPCPFIPLHVVGLDLLLERRDFLMDLHPACLCMCEWVIGRVLWGEIRVAKVTLLECVLLWWCYLDRKSVAQFYDKGALHIKYTSVW